MPRTEGRGQRAAPSRGRSALPGLAATPAPNDHAPMTTGSTRAQRRREHVVRAVTTLLLATFALPACVTRSLWTEGRTLREADAAAADLAVPTPAPSPFAFAVPPAALTQPLAARSNAAPDAGWMVLRPVAHDASVATALADPRRGPIEVRIHLDAVAERDEHQVTLHIDLPAEDPDSRLPGTTRWLGPWHRWQCWLEVGCTATFVREPPPGCQPIQARLVLQERDPQTLLKVLVTPLTVALDVVLSPLELLTAPLWW